MLDIIFQNSKYSFNNTALNLQYFDSGDLHGNDNFRTQNKSLSVYEILQQINPLLRNLYLDKFQFIEQSKERTCLFK